MGADYQNPLDELKSLDQQVDRAKDLDALKPIIQRLDEVAQMHASDFEVQLVVGDIKQHLVTRSTKLREQRPPSGIIQPPAAPPPVAPPPIPPPIQEEQLGPSDQTLPIIPAVTPVAPAVAASPPVEPPKPPETPKTVRVPPPPIAPQLRPKQPQPPGPPFNWKRPVVVGVAAGALVSIVLISVLVSQARKRSRVQTAAAAVHVAVTTTPPGASVRVTPAQGGEEKKCDSNCQLDLAPGDYQVAAFLDGYQPAASGLIVAAGQPASVTLRLEPQPQAVRILTDLDKGQVSFDSQPAADLQEGQFIIDKVEPGTHTVKITGKNGEASFSFEVAEAKLPAVTGPVTTRNLIAVLVSNVGTQAHVTASSGPVKVALNGQPQGEAGPGGVDLKDFQAGVNEIVVGEGKDARNMKESFGPAPMLTAFVKSDVDAGTLIVSTGENDVHVFLNNKEYRQRTQRGQVRIQTIGKVTVRVAKDGFQEEPPQVAEIKKGAELRLEFSLKPQPRVAALQIRGAIAGVDVLIDQNRVGAVGADGTFNYNTVPPGDHTIELRRDQFVPKRVQRAFPAGQTIVLAGADVVLAASNATLRLARTPPNATVTYRRADEAEAHEIQGNQLELPAGEYVISAKAAGFADLTQRVQVAGGETRALEITLPRARAAAPPPPLAGTIADFEDAAAWKKNGDVWVHKGGGFVPYKLPVKGTYTFTAELVKGGGVFRGGRIRWYFQYVDAKNYLLFELDRKNFWAEVVENGKKLERTKVEHDLDNQKSFTFQIEATPERLVHKVRKGDDWMVLDSFSEPGRDFSKGKFGFLIQGNDELGVSDFKFTPK